MVGIIFYIMTVAWIIGAAVTMRKALSIKNSGQKITAHVTAHESTDNKNFTPVVSYTLDGKYHENRCGRASRTKMPMRSEVNIIVSQKYPDYPVFENENLFVTPIFCVTIAVIALCVSIYITVL